MPTESHDSATIELLDRIAQRDATALKALYGRCGPRLFGLALRIMRRHDWAEDVLQEAFLTIWRVAGDYRASLSPPWAWLGLIVRSRSLDMLRRQAADGSLSSVELDESLEDQLAGDDPGPVDLVQASQQAAALHQCLSRLEHRQRQALSLAYMRDLSQSELASQLRVPLGTVKSWMRRGLEQLRLCMSRFA